MTEKQVEQDAYVYTALMKGYSALGNTERVHELFKEMEEKGIIPTEVTFSTAIQAYIADGGLSGAQSFFNKMKNGYGLQPNVYIYSSMLTVCVTARDLETAKEIFREMILSRVEANNVVLSSMIDVYAECCNEENGKQYFEECRALMKDMQLKGIMSNEQTYSTLLKLCSRGELTADSMNILEEVRSNHIRPNVVSYSTILDGISKDEKLSSKEVSEMSSRIVSEMKNEEIHLNAMSYTSLINVALRMRDLYGAARLFMEMKRLKVDPTNVTYGAMIKCHEKLGNPNDGESYLKPCLDLWYECEKAGLKLTKEGYTSLLSACANAANLDQALIIWDKLIVNKIKPDVLLYAAMFNACLSKDKEDMAFEFYNEMGTSGIKPDVATYGTFLSYFLKKKDRAGAEKIHAEMKTLGVQPNKAILRMMKALSVG